MGNAALLIFVIPLVSFLGYRLVRDTAEVRDYTEKSLKHGLAVTANLDPVPALATTADLVRTARDAAARYAGAVERMLEGRS